MLKGIKLKNNKQRVPILKMSLKNGYCDGKFLTLNTFCVLFVVNIHIYYVRKVIEVSSKTSRSVLGTDFQMYIIAYAFMYKRAIPNLKPVKTINQAKPQ